VDSTIPYTFTGAAGIVDGPSATKTTLTKKNTGTLTINTANTYSGGTMINNGTIQVGNATALGAGGVSFYPGAPSTAKLQLNGNSISLTSLTTDAVTPGTPVVENGSSSDATLTFTNEANDTYAGILQDGSTGKLGVTFAGFGNFYLAGNANTYSGDTMIMNYGYLHLGIDNALPHGNGKGIIDFEGGTLDLNSHSAIINGFSNTGGLILNDVAATTSTLTVGDGNITSIFSGSILENGNGKIALAKIGSGQLTISSPGAVDWNNYSGGTTLSAGTIQTGYASALGTGPLSMASGTTLDVQYGTLNVGGLSGDGLITTTSSGSSVLTTTSAATADTSFVGVIQNGSGTMGLTKAGAGTLTLASANTYTGVTTLNGGTLVVPTLANGGVISSIGQSSSDPTSLVFNGGTLHYTGPSVVLDRGFTTNGGSLMVDNDVTIQGNIVSTSGNFSKKGSGTLTFANSSTDPETPNALSRFFVNAGTAAFTSGIYNTTSIYVGLDGGPATLSQSSGSLSFEYELIIGCDGGRGDYLMTGGTLAKTLPNSSVWIGLRNTGNMEMSNGAVFNLSGQDWDGGFFIGAYGGNGIFTVNDATFNTSGPVFVGFLDGSSGEMTLNDSATVTTSNDLLIGVYGGHGSLTLNGNASLENINPTAPRGTQLGGDGTGELNLNGGTFTTVSIKGNANGTVNFNGGVLKAAADSTELLSSSLVCNVKAGGATIDTNGVNVTAGASLLHGGLATESDGGLKKVGDGMLTLTGALSYQGDTTVNQGALTLTTALNTPNAEVYVASDAILSVPSLVADTLTIGGAPRTANMANAAAVPEPGTLLLLTLASMIALLVWRRK
jgi:fibronectin-binding autotransporter adhesin